MTYADILKITVPIIVVVVLQWLRFEHRITKLETAFNIFFKHNGGVK